MVIRRIRSTDGPFLTDLVAAYRHEQGREFSAHDRVACSEQFRALAGVDRRGDGSEGALTWVAAGSGKHSGSPDVPIGYLNAHLGHFPLLGGTELYISDLIVHPEFRGQGIGSQLLATAEDYARSVGCVRVMLNNRKADPSYSRNFYPGMGYEERTEVANMVKGLKAKLTTMKPQEVERPSTLEIPPVDRFLGKAQPYRKARPGYPQEIFALIAPEPGKTIVELGAGTGIFSTGLLERGVRVWAVEPNPDMLNILEEELLAYTGARIVPKAAHETGLEDHCADAVVCAQSFHWFADSPTLQEILRILKPGGPLWLVWNRRADRGDGVAPALEALYQEVSPGYSKTRGNHLVDGQSLRSALESLGYPPQIFEENRWENSQVLDKEGLLARVESNSFWPRDPDLRAKAKKKVGKLFHDFSKDEKITLHYDTFGYRVEFTYSK